MRFYKGLGINTLARTYARQNTEEEYRTVRSQSDYWRAVEDAIAVFLYGYRCAGTAEEQALPETHGLARGQQRPSDATALLCQNDSNPRPEAWMLDTGAARHIIGRGFLTRREWAQRYTIPPVEFIPVGGVRTQPTLCVCSCRR